MQGQLREEMGDGGRVRNEDGKEDYVSVEDVEGGNIGKRLEDWKIRGRNTRAMKG